MVFLFFSEYSTGVSISVCKSTVNALPVNANKCEQFPAPKVMKDGLHVTLCHRGCFVWV